jgi:hypothetical protein
MKAQDGKPEFVTALLSAKLVEALDRYASEKAPDKTRSDILSEAFEEWCIERGLLWPWDKKGR